MGIRGVAALVGGVVLAGAAVAVGGVVRGGDGSGGGPAPVDAASMQRDMARRLPDGWTARVVHAAGGGYDVWLRHPGDVRAAIRSMRTHDVVDINKPAMLTLLPQGATQHTDFVFHLGDSTGDGELIRAAAGPHHPGRTPVLLLASKEFMQAEIDAAMPKVTMTPFVVGGPAGG
ncbi:hypothetical protein [Actinacidiphila rubida]|uniref:Uncharacterized protein n=1 Tax=Actinacidiphila rubida TaxID=310780 RepID=A0A1H8M9U2_9ACTN|nr:hypothetical protein [Actinacidiphila rubida]SEO14074.1 hypothetical protein SAMN05216267_101888 [Actinacidiphila rubida]